MIQDQSARIGQVQDLFRSKSEDLHRIRVVLYQQRQNFLQTVYRHIILRILILFKVSADSQDFFDRVVGETANIEIRSFDRRPIGIGTTESDHNRIHGCLYLLISL